MNEYQDQEAWFELRAFDGFQWHFIADFDNPQDAHSYAEASEVMATYENHHVRRVTGVL